MPRKKDRLAVVHRESQRKREEQNALAWAATNPTEWNFKLPIPSQKRPADQLPSDQYRAALRWEAAREWRSPAELGLHWAKAIDAFWSNAEKSLGNPMEAAFRVAAVCWPSEAKAVAEYDQTLAEYTAAKHGLSDDDPDLEEQYFETRQAVRKADIALEKHKALTGPRDWRWWNLYHHLLKVRRLKLDWRMPWRSLPPGVRREWVKAARGPVQVRLLGPAESATTEVDRHSLLIHLPMSASSKQAVDALKAAMTKHKLSRQRPESTYANALRRLSILRLSDHGMTWAMSDDLEEKPAYTISKATWHRELKRAKAEFHSGHWLR